MSFLRAEPQSAHVTAKPLIVSPHLAGLHPVHVVVVLVRGLEQEAGLHPLDVDADIGAAREVAQCGVSDLQATISGSVDRPLTLNCVYDLFVEYLGVHEGARVGIILNVLGLD